jgi:hypothetical protein
MDGTRDALRALHDAVALVLRMYTPLPCQHRHGRAGEGCPGPCPWCQLALAVRDARRVLGKEPTA